MKFLRSKNKNLLHWKLFNFMGVSGIIKRLLLSLSIIIEGFFATTILAQDDFLNYINDQWDYENVLVLGVDAKSDWAKGIDSKTHFDLVIPVSREGGSSIEDWTRAGLAKLGIPTAGLNELEGKKIRNLFGHSWGSSEVINAIDVGKILKVENLHLIGSPHSASFSSLGNSISNGSVKKVYFHINEGDNISTFKDLPSGLSGTFTGQIEFHLYSTEKSTIDTNHKSPFNIPIFNAPVGYDVYENYNCPATDHGFENYTANIIFTLKNNPKQSPFNERTNPFLAVPSYWTNRNSDQPSSKNINEAQIMTEMVQGKKKAVIIGNGDEAELMNKNMINKLGEKNTKWIKTSLSDRELQLSAKKFGADVILGVREYNKLDSGRAGASYESADVGINDVHKYSSEVNKTSNPESYGLLGKGDLSGGLISNDIGGVMLHSVAKVSNEKEIASELGGGTFSLIFQNTNGEIDIGKLRKFVTALWAVYFSEDGPGISIDPIAPGVDKHLVRYIGLKVINSDLGRVMRETDYAMKKWAVGTEKPDIEGFKSVDALTGQYGLQYLGASRRFWFVPEDMRFKLVGDALLYDSGRMTLKTEYIFLNKETKAEPADEEFARFFTEHYNEIALKYPVYNELLEYAKFVSLGRYLKDKGVPLLWFLLANKDMVITEDSPGTVDALAKNSDYYEYVKIEGGVDLTANSSAASYVIDQEAAQALNKAVSLYGTSSLKESSVLSYENLTFETSDHDFTLNPSNNLTLSGGTAIGDKFQTDLALHYGKEPGLELVRYYDLSYEGPYTFGRGWHLMIPYQVEPYGENKIEFLNARIPEKMVVKNLFTGREEILTFSTDRYSIAGYVPEILESSNLIGLFLLSDASYRMADKLGNEFQFDQEGTLTEMNFSEDYCVKFEYDSIDINIEESNILPYRLETAGDEYAEVPNSNIKLPKRLTVFEDKTGKDELFVYNENNRFDIVGYTPLNGGKSRYTILAFDAHIN